MFDTTIQETVKHLNGRFASELVKIAKSSGADDVSRLAQSRRELGKIKLVLRFRARNGENIVDQRKRAEATVQAVKELNSDLRRKELAA